MEQAYNKQAVTAAELRFWAGVYSKGLKDTKTAARLLWLAARALEEPVTIRDKTSMGTLGKGG